jgi:CDP-diacylglycerol--glycerol-3-phosphate 3-phosphatidyltransferase
VFIVASLTDWFDGYLARTRQQITTLGQLLDPIADKLLISAALISLVELDLAPAWMVVIIIGRELAISGLRPIAADQGIEIPSSSLGKYKTTVQMLTIILLILGPAYLGDYLFIGEIGLWLVVVLSLISAAQYFFGFWKRLRLNGELS